MKVETTDQVGVAQSELEAEQLIKIYEKEDFVVIRINYLGQITPEEFVKALVECLGKNNYYSRRILVAFNDRSPANWAGMIVVAKCSFVSHLIGVDKRDGSDESCLVVSSSDSEWPIGKRFATPDPDCFPKKGICNAVRSNGH